MSLTAAELTPPVGADDLDEWLTSIEEYLAELMTTFMADHVPDAVRAYAATVTAAGNLDAFDVVEAQWAKLITDDVGDVLGGVYAGGGLSAWVQQPSTVQPGPDFADAWSKVVNQEAVEYQRVATNRIVGASQQTWNDVRGRTVRAVRAGYTNEELTKVVQDVTQYSEYRANTIARTETVAAYNGGNYTGAQAMGKHGPAEKWWLAAEDARTRPTHAEADGQVVPFDQPFIVGGVPMSRPHDPTAPARETVNCRCVMNLLYPGDTRPDGSLVESDVEETIPLDTGQPETTFTPPELTPPLPPTPLPPPPEPELIGGVPARSQAEAMAWWRTAQQHHVDNINPNDLIEQARKDYIGGSHARINKGLRENPDALIGKVPAELKDEVELLDAAISVDGVKVPGDVMLFRGAHVPDGIGVGDVVPDPAFGSFSVNEYTSRGFAGFDNDSVLFRVTERDDDMNFAFGSSLENELIGPRNLEMDVLSIEDNPLGGKIANVRLRRAPEPSVAPLGRMTDEDLVTWIKGALDTNPKASPTSLLQQFKAAGGSVSDRRFRELARDIKAGGTGQRGVLVPDVPELPPARPWDVPIAGNKSHALTARAPEKGLRRHLKGEDLTSSYKPGAAKADVARKLTARIEGQGQSMKPNAWNKVLAEGGDPRTTVFQQAGGTLQVNQPLTDLYRSLDFNDKPIFERGLTDSSYRAYNWSDEWKAAYTRGQGHYSQSKNTLGMHLSSEEMTNGRVSELVHQWAITSNDNNATSLNLQRAAIEEFGLDPDKLADWTISDTLQAAMDADWAANASEYRLFLRAMYDETQQMFADQGVTTVRAVRGFSFHGGSHSTPDWAYSNGDIDTVKLRPMSSFAWTKRQADKFSGGVHTYSEIPVERIIGTPRSGFGCLDETELVVLGGDNTMSVTSTLRRPLGWTPPGTIT